MEEKTRAMRGFFHFEPSKKIVIPAKAGIQRL